MIPLLLFSKFVNYSAKNAKTVAILLAWTMFLFGIIQASVASIGSVFARLLEIDVSAFMGNNLSGLQFVGQVNAILPVSEFIGLLTIYLTAWGIVILIRWIKSFVPSIGN